jgi:hypothetical protein
MRFPVLGKGAIAHTSAGISAGRREAIAPFPLFPPFFPFFPLFSPFFSFFSADQGNAKTSRLFANGPRLLPKNSKFRIEAENTVKICIDRGFPQHFCKIIIKFLKMCEFNHPVY